MRFSHFVLCLSYALSGTFANPVQDHTHLAIRQDNTNSDFPTLGRSSVSLTASATTPSSQQPSESPNPTPTSTTNQSDEDNAVSSTTFETLSTTVPEASTSVSSLATEAANPASTNTAQEDIPGALPLPPKITPALSVGGVFLIITGIGYALIGVKNRWVHVALSTAYLASLAVLVLIVYVVDPPISNAVQGAYFVGIFMAGLIFGGGALIFKDITEGLGCLLGGFCLSMWFLTLKEGGLITNTGGKAIFIAVFCVVCWCLSFSHYTRAYGLIGSTSFSGSTAFVLGVDCFSRCGLKEFWIYLWNLNQNIFPLNTNTYPITRGNRVQTVVIILGTIIGVISQIKLWKVVQDRQKQREAAIAEEERRQDAVEEALGRHLERQNDRDRSEWEKRYGNRLDAKRSTMLWEKTRGDKRCSSTSTTEVSSSHNSDSRESLEMNVIQSAVVKPPLHSSKSKQQSHITVQAIPEEEDEIRPAEQHTSKRESYLQETKPGEFLPMLMSEKLGFDHSSFTPTPLDDTNKVILQEDDIQLDKSQSLKPQNSKPSAKTVEKRLHLGENDARPKKRSSIPSLSDIKRRSMQSLSSLSPKDEEKSTGDFSESKEALVMPATSIGTHSRASSVAATMDEENEKLDMPALDVEDNLKRDSRPPQIVISPVLGMSLEARLRAGLQGPPSPSGLSDQFADPEELVRTPTKSAHGILNFDSDLGNVVNCGREVEKTGAAIGHIPSSEGLTQGALEKVPNQTSNVVMSYRTNEWAKHIAFAEAPIFEEPDPVVLQDAELPTHLANPTVSAKPASEPEFIEKSSPLPSPIQSVAPSDSGIKVNPSIQPAEPAKSPSLSGTDPIPSPNIPSRTPSQMSITNPNRRSFTDSVQPATAMPKSSRRLSNPMQRQPSLIQHSVIDENAAMSFIAPASGPHRTTSNATNRTSQHFYISPNSSTIDLTRSGNVSGQPAYPSAFKRDLYTNMNQNYSQPDIRPTIALSTTPYAQQAAVRSETRLNEFGRQSHQPLSRNNTDTSRRENLMADWRMQLAHSHNTNVVPQAHVDNHYDQHLMDRETMKAQQDHERYMKAQKQVVMDQGMRTQGMIDAHREVLKRMQSQANKKLT